MEVSLCMIVRNGSRTIARCLDSVHDLVDEIVMVDTGSTDDTKDVVRRYTERVYDFAWRDDFAAARNAAFDYATRDYILWLDADDVLLEEDRSRFRRLKMHLDDSVDAVSMAYNLAFDEEGNVTARLRRIRLVKRARGFRWHGAVHEDLMVDGSVVDSDVAITHRPVGERDKYRNLRIYDHRAQAGHPSSPRDRFYYANECLECGRYEQAIQGYETFLNDEDGRVEDKILACGRLADGYRELGQLDAARQAALRMLEFDIPRAEFCCRMGYDFVERKAWRQAAFWYEMATQVPRPDTWALTNEACWTWLPHIQLCVCYYQLGDHQRAYEHNERARQYRPNDEQVLQNKAYLESTSDLEA